MSRFNIKNWIKEFQFLLNAKLTKKKKHFDVGNRITHCLENQSTRLNTFLLYELKLINKILIHWNEVKQFVMFLVVSIGVSSGLQTPH